MANYLNHEYVAHALELFGSDTEFCVFDLETTTKFSEDKPNPHAKVMQIAARAYRVDRSRGTTSLIGELNVLINDPTFVADDLHPKAYETHGISIDACRRTGIIHDDLPVGDNRRMTVARMDPKAAWGAFLRLVANRTLIGQNILAFDIPFANAELIRWGFDRRLNSSRAIDTLLIARHVYDVSVYKLRALATHFRVQTDPRLDHNALGDIDTTWRVWLAMQPTLNAYAARFIKGTPNQYKRQLGSLGTAWQKG